jgi:Zn-dependent protease with chaperone function
MAIPQTGRITEARPTTSVACASRGIEARGLRTSTHPAARSMFGSPRSIYLVVVLIALVPGVISWWSGRRLARRADDPALPELLAAHRRRNGAMFGVAMVVPAFVASFSRTDIGFPIVLGGVVAYAGLIAAAYPLRRALYEDTWGFFAYFFFFPRTILGLFGFWMVLAALPGVAALARERDWIVSSLVGLALVFWNTRHADVVRWCLRTRSLEEGDLLAGCRLLAQRSGLSQTRFERIDLGGGVIPNALALPSLRTSSVLFTDTVLQRFDQQEVLAICAHELAHFEHYNPAYLRRLNAVNYLLIALGVVAAPAARVAGADWGILAAILWLAAVVTSLAVRARGKQRQETACDLRAVELTGDGEALVRGLTKLYTIARLPRRLDHRTEQSATHPSLARRIRDIRKASGSVAAPLSDARSFTSTDGRTVVTFDEAGVRWVERDIVTHTLSYGHLSDLRIELRRGRGARLVAVGAENRRWELSLQDADIAGVQAVLDVVDGRLADPAPGSVTPPHLQRLVVVTVAAIVLALSQVAVALVALLAWRKPTTPLLAGAGAAVLTAAALLLRDYGAGYLVAMSLPLAATSVMFLGLAWTRRKAPHDGTRPLIAALALAAWCTIVAVSTRGSDLVSLHRATRAVPSATVLLVALAGALGFSRTRTERLAGAAVGIIALATAGVASTAVLDRFGADPFLVEAPPLRWVALESVPIQAFEVPSDTSRIDLSPSGRYVAVHQDAGGDDERQGNVQVGRVGAALTSIPADDVAFVSDEQVLIVRSDSHGTTLKTERLGATREVVWERVLEDLTAPSLSLDRATGRWDLLGWEGEESIVRVEGMVGGSTVEEKRWPVAQERDGYIAAFTASGPDALVLEMRYERGMLARALPWRWTWAHLLLPTRAVSRYATVSEHGRRAFAESKLDVDCVADVTSDGALACTAYDGSRTRIVRISPTTAQVEGVGLIDGRFVTDQRAVRGWLTGWTAGRPAAIRLSLGDAFRMPTEARIIRLMPVAEDRLAALVIHDNRFTVRVYPLSPSTPSIDARQRIPRIQTRR